MRWRRGEQRGMIEGGRDGQIKEGHVRISDMGGKRCFKNDPLRTKTGRKVQILTDKRKKERASNLYTVYKSVNFFFVVVYLYICGQKRRKLHSFFSAVTALPAAVFSWGCEFMVPSDHVGAMI